MLIQADQITSKRIQNKSNKYKDLYSFSKVQNKLITKEPVKMTAIAISKQITKDIFLVYVLACCITNLILM